MLTPFRLWSLPPLAISAVTSSPSTSVTVASIRPSSSRIRSPSPTPLIDTERPTRSGVAVSPGAKTTSEPDSSSTWPSISAVRTSGPLRSTISASERSPSASTSRTRSITVARCSVDPWLALSRATDIPASFSARMVSVSLEAGPSVQTIFAFRMAWRTTGNLKKPHDPPVSDTCRQRCGRS